MLPLVEDNAWFFDTELLVLAERSGLRIHEVPVDWVDDPDSRVDIVRTALDDVRGIVRVGRGLVSGRLPVSDVAERLGRASADAGSGRLGMQVAMFALVGVALDPAYAGLFLLLRGRSRPSPPTCWRCCSPTLANTAANRRLTFGVTRAGGSGAAPGARADGLPGRARRHVRARCGCCTRRGTTITASRSSC